MDQELAEVVLRQGELKLDAQLRIAIAADSRATAFAALFVTLAVATTSAAGILWKLGSGYVPLFVGTVGMALLLLVAAFLCIRVALPADFFTVGNQPDNWWKDETPSKPLVDCLVVESNNYQTRILRNRESLRQNGDRLVRALYLGLMSPIPLLGIVVVAQLLP